MSADDTNSDGLSSRIAALEKQADLTSRITTLEKQAAELSAYLRAAVIIAAVFGVAGAWGLQALTQARDLWVGHPKFYEMLCGYRKP